MSPNVTRKRNKDIFIQIELLFRSLVDVGPCKDTWCVHDIVFPLCNHSKTRVFRVATSPTCTFFITLNNNPASLRQRAE